MWVHLPAAPGALTEVTDGHESKPRGMEGADLPLHRPVLRKEPEAAAHSVGSVSTHQFAAFGGVQRICKGKEKQICQRWPRGAGLCTQKGATTCLWQAEAESEELWINKAGNGAAMVHRCGGRGAPSRAAGTARGKSHSANTAQGAPGPAAWPLGAHSKAAQRPLGCGMKHSTALPQDSTARATHTEQSQLPPAREQIHSAEEL